MLQQLNTVSVHKGMAETVIPFALLLQKRNEVFQIYGRRLYIDTRESIS